MEPVAIALICAAGFGAVVAFSVFIRQLLLSRDKNLNDEAQRKAISQEAGELAKMREQMQSNKRFDSHYQVLGANKDAIIYLDTKIEDVLHKKTQLIERYAQVSLKESGAIVDGEVSEERKAACDRLKREIDEEIKFYDSELEHLQKRRSSLWDTHTDLQEYLLNQEKSRNENLDFIYKQHSGLLEKIYLRHTDHSEHIAKQTIEAGTSSFKTMILAPIQFLMNYFNISTGISFDRAKIEKASRDKVDKAQRDVNDSEHSDNDVNTDDEVKSDDSDVESDEDVDSDNDYKLIGV
ncbi:hypothetical protein [Legionella worsleiensis]|uniref:Uncharacterized protein n=1 Tax=Legionella worsleiensis TaxID=45076 RepID=A0A0W1A3T2_9GAMM|nr:hypothetical protein [Legionella worsleiensis]KTD76023.1 hypothetical protein Lwor_2589 [Legionella worsleiensis]STY33037.1 Uncharacterised protein [Legionella worsleiensis]